LRLGELCIDVNERRAILRGRELSLTPTEFRLLVTLAREPGHLFQYCDLAERVLGYACTEREARPILQVHVNNLRHKLDDDACKPQYILCVRGVGYRWAVNL